MTTICKHTSLNATLRGLALGPVTQFRGIRYARIPARFAPGEAVDDWEGRELDCTGYGPRCPQVHIDVGHLLRIPEDIVLPREEEDEFDCVNLDVTVPADVAGQGGGLPVLIWIHGGSQVMTFGSAASRVCDTTKIVADSATLAKPMIVVSVQYRLNIFAFGDGNGPKNLALKDQRLAIDWVRKHIAGFGGDAENITLAGESAGAVYTHAHVVTNAPVRRAILASGSLGLSPPRSPSDGEPIIAALERKLEGTSLRDAPAEDVVRVQAELNLQSLWIQMTPEEPGLSEWTSKIGQIEALLLGDAEYESIIWRNGMETMTAGMIVEAFDLAGDQGQELRRLYGISAARPTPSKTGALDFCSDVRYGLPMRKLSQEWRSAGRPVYAYVLDQANPWQASSRAHHAVDLPLLFGGFDLTFNAAAAAVGSEMRRRWIWFVAGSAPWAADKTFAFGPFGECKELDGRGVRARRRVGQLQQLEGMGAGAIDSVFGGLAGGRGSLLN